MDTSATKWTGVFITIHLLDDGHLKFSGIIKKKQSLTENIQLTQFVAHSNVIGANIEHLGRKCRWTKETLKKTHL